jgi:hypothetical protein
MFFAIEKYQNSILLTLLRDNIVIIMVICAVLLVFSFYWFCIVKYNDFDFKKANIKLFSIFRKR